MPTPPEPPPAPPAVASEIVPEVVPAAVETAEAEPSATRVRHPRSESTSAGSSEPAREGGEGGRRSTKIIRDVY